MTELQPVQNGDISRILGFVHVMTPYREAVREVASRLARPWAEIDKRTKRYIIAATIQQHKINRAVYDDVMTGNLSMPEPVPRYWFRASDKAVIIKEG